MKNTKKELKHKLKVMALQMAIMNSYLHKEDQLLYYLITNDLSCLEAVCKARDINIDLSINKYLKDF